MGLCFGRAKLGWPMAMRSPCHGTGGVGGRPSAWRACPLPAAAPALPAAELEHRPLRHGARRWQAAQLHEPCHGGHSRRNVWGEYRSFCSRRHAEEHGVVLRLCLPSPESQAPRSSCAGEEEPPLARAQPRLALLCWHHQGWRCHLHPSLTRPRPPTAPVPWGRCMGKGRRAWEPGQQPRGFIAGKVTRLISHRVKQ